MNNDAARRHVAAAEKGGRHGGGSYLQASASTLEMKRGGMSLPGHRDMLRFGRDGRFRIKADFRKLCTRTNLWVDALIQNV